mgnify:CR=1 FL=1
MGNPQYTVWRRINSFNKLRRRSIKNIKNMTPAEKAVWKELQELNKCLPYGVYWQRQYITHHYLIDFCCRKVKLAIEVDGSSHIGREQYDANRQDILERAGFEFIRISNSDTYDVERLQALIRAVGNKTVFKWEKIADKVFVK